MSSLLAFHYAPSGFPLVVVVVVVTVVDYPELHLYKFHDLHFSFQMNSVPVFIVVIILGSVIEKARGNGGCYGNCFSKWNRCFSSCVHREGDCLKCNTMADMCRAECSKKRHFHKRWEDILAARTTEGVKNSSSVKFK